MSQSSAPRTLHSAAADVEVGEGLWTVADVARYLKASRSWVYHRAESGELPCLRVGGLLRFEPDVIRRYARGVRPGIPSVSGLPPASIALRRNGSR